MNMPQFESISVCGKRGGGFHAVLLCCLVCTMLTAMTSSLDVYPWSGKDFLDRSQEILDNLRNNMGLDVVGEDILAAIQSAPNRELIARNLEGTEFAVRISNPKDQEIKKRSELEELRYNSALLNKKLEGLCSVMAVDYWNYEWCHR